MEIELDTLKLLFSKTEKKDKLWRSQCGKLSLLNKLRSFSGKTALCGLVSHVGILKRDFAIKAN